jgi:hypothetical protein
MRKEYNISLVTLGTIVLGIDYAWNLVPGLPEFLTLNRFLFLAILGADLLFYSEKYLRAGKICLAGALIFIGCLPYLIFTGGSLENVVLGPGLKLLGSFAYLLFFYVNCRDAGIAGRISTILICSGGLIALYVLGSELGLFGGKTLRWRGAVEFTSASGIFDPNIITMNYLPAFRRAMLEEIGFYPEDFFFFKEEEYLSLKALDRGWRMVYHPGVIIRHPQILPWADDTSRDYYLFRNPLFVVIELFPGIYLWKYLFFRLASYFLVSFQRNSFPAYCRAVGALPKKLASILPQRLPVSPEALRRYFALRGNLPVL